MAAVLDAYTPTEHEVDEHAQRLRGHRMRLVALAVVSEVTERDEQTASLVERGRTIRTEEVPTDHGQAVGHILRMAWTLDELLERLVARQCLKEAPWPSLPSASHTTRGPPSRETRVSPWSRTSPRGKGRTRRRTTSSSRATPPACGCTTRTRTPVTETHGACSGPGAGGTPSTPKAGSPVSRSGS
ncbi:MULTISPECIES: DUF6415 family natural product biosynthesis protein [unclassified Streptomyces]|uniref:DUF6415 family natural product biosynthesis protein n=1 Tax=unclassified Streptomyces TaxID=2593676 RepID=UPI003B641DCE